MALNGIVLGTEITAILDPLRASIPQNAEMTPAEIAEFDTGIATAIINHFNANGYT